MLYSYSPFDCHRRAKANNIRKDHHEYGGQGPPGRCGSCTGRMGESRSLDSGVTDACQQNSKQPGLIPVTLAQQFARLRKNILDQQLERRVQNLECSS